MDAGSLIHNGAFPKLCRSHRQASHGLPEPRNLGQAQRVEVIDIRAIDAGAEELMSGDRYLFMREAYLQQRNYLVSGELQDDFSDSGEEYFDRDEE